MKAREVRALARESLQGKWGKGAVLTLVYLILVFILSFLLGLVPFIGSIVDIIITPVLGFGILVSFIKLSRNQDPSNVGFFEDGFNSFGKVWKVTLQIFVRMLLPILLFVLSGILNIVATFAANISSTAVIINILSILIPPIAIAWIIVKSYSFILSMYILHDEPNLTSSEIVKKSVILMNGNKFRFFCLELSFIGWALLSALTFGIGYFWLLPYVEVSSIKFYEDVISSNNYYI